MMTDFWSDDSLTVKTGSRLAAMVDPSIDAEYPTLLFWLKILGF